MVSPHKGGVGARPSRGGLATVWERTTPVFATEVAEKEEEPQRTISTERGRAGGKEEPGSVDTRDKMIS